jgi:hypothetical protein
LKGNFNPVCGIFLLLPRSLKITGAALRLVGAPNGEKQSLGELNHKKEMRSGPWRPKRRGTMKRRFVLGLFFGLLWLLPCVAGANSMAPMHFLSLEEYKAFILARYGSHVWNGVYTLEALPEPYSLRQIIMGDSGGPTLVYSQGPMDREDWPVNGRDITLRWFPPLPGAPAIGGKGGGFAIDDRREQSATGELVYRMVRWEQDGLVFWATVPMDFSEEMIEEALRPTKAPLIDVRPPKHHWPWGVYGFWAFCLALGIWGLRPCGEKDALFFPQRGV